MGILTLAFPYVDLSAYGREVALLAHNILYDHGFGGDEHFRTLTVVWEPHTNRVSLRFRNKRESASGMVGTIEEIIDYLDSRAASGYPWDTEGPREARAKLSHVMGGDAPADPLAQPTVHTTLRVG